MENTLSSKVQLYIAMSLDGKIAKPNDDVSWLDEIPNPDKSDYGYHDFYGGIDIVVMGNSTYRFVQSMDIEYPYNGKTSYVITRDSSLQDNEDVCYVSGDQVLEIIKDLRKSSNKNIWLVGGGEVNTLFSNTNLIDEIILFVMPIIIGDGIPLFGQGLGEKQLILRSSQVYQSGVVELNYKFRENHS